MGRAGQLKTSHKASFKCDVCGNTFKKETTLRKHVNTKHQEQNCKVCNAKFQTTMDVLQHVAEEHSNNIKEISFVQPKENEDQMNSAETNVMSKGQDSFDSSAKFKCFKCKEIVSLDDKFNDDLKEEQMCKVCTMFQAYG